MPADLATASAVTIMASPAQGSEPKLSMTQFSESTCPPRTTGISPDRVRSVGSPVCHEIEDGPCAAQLHTHGGLVYAGSGSTAGLTYPHARHLLRSDQSSRPGTAVEGLRLSDRTTEVNVVHHLRVPLLRLQPPLGSGRPEGERVDGLQRSLPAHEG